jgi:acetylornithine deacetylase
LAYHDENGISKSCLVARKGPVSGGGLAYFGHTDVVPVNSWSFAASGPWTPHVADGRMYGRGSCDMRGSLACMLSAAHELRHAKFRAPIFYVVTADEEVGMHGARKVVEDSQLYRQIVAAQPASIVGEPTSLDVVYAHKGGRAVRATSIGRAAHSSTGQGVNATSVLRSTPFYRRLRFHADAVALRTSPRRPVIGGGCVEI